MSESLDHLSIEELQSQLLQIQRRIQEKEKLQVIEKITSLLMHRDGEFVRTVLDLVEGKKHLGREEKSSVKAAALTEEKPKKEGAYLRNGKVFFGIQEIKYTKFDKNQVLRISKEGKGLPPRVDAFPDEIRIALLALPLRAEASPLSTSELDTVVDEHLLSPASVAEPETLAIDLAEPEAAESKAAPALSAKPIKPASLQGSLF